MKESIQEQDPIISDNQVHEFAQTAADSTKTYSREMFDFLIAECGDEKKKAILFNSELCDSEKSDDLDKVIKFITTSAVERKDGKILEIIDIPSKQQPFIFPIVKENQQACVLLIYNGKATYIDPRGLYKKPGELYTVDSETTLQNSEIPAHIKEILQNNKIEISVSTNILQPTFFQNDVRCTTNNHDAPIIIDIVRGIIDGRIEMKQESETGQTHLYTKNNEEKKYLQFDDAAKSDKHGKSCRFSDLGICSAIAKNADSQEEIQKLITQLSSEINGKHTEDHSEKISAAQKVEKADKTTASSQKANTFNFNLSSLWNRFIGFLAVTSVAAAGRSTEEIFNPSNNGTSLRTAGNNIDQLNIIPPETPYPSLSPTTLTPSYFPTSKPSISHSPSYQPTSQPSNRPSQQPTSQPSSPTQQPSSQPTKKDEGDTKTMQLDSETLFGKYTVPFAYLLGITAEAIIDICDRDRSIAGFFMNANNPTIAKAGLLVLGMVVSGAVIMGTDSGLGEKDMNAVSQDAGVYAAVSTAAFVAGAVLTAYCCRCSQNSRTQTSNSTQRREVNFNKYSALARKNEVELSTRV